MQLTGQGATHSSQPLHQASSTACMRLGAPTIASTGHTCRQIVQPMQRASSTTAIACAIGPPQSGSSGSGVVPVRAASASIVVAPPGGQRLISAPSRAMAPA